MGTRISQFTPLTTVASADYFPLVQASDTTNKRVSLASLLASVPLGAAATPSIAFTADTDTGIYSPGANQVAVATNGTQRLTVDTAATTSTLPVVHPLGAVGTPSLTFTGDLNTGFYSPAADTLAAVTGGSNRLHITSGGLVGIGTSSPNARLHLNGPDYTALSLSDFFGATHAIRVNSRLDNTKSLFLGVSSGASDVISIGVASSTTQAEPLALQPFGGNVGIGTTSPGSALEINAAASTSPFIAKINTAEAARIDSSGRLLVGTSTDLAGGSHLFQVNASTTGIAVKTAATNSDNYTCWNAATSGNNAFINFYTETSITARGGITYNRAGGLVVYATTSDYRAKDIIGPVQNPGATIDALRVYEGKMKGATQSRPMLIAHEAQEHAPYTVTGEKDAVEDDGTPKFQQMDMSALVPLLLAEIQSLRQRVATLESA